MSFLINPYLVQPSGPSYDSDAQAFFTAAGITDTTQKSAVNQLVLDLKSYSIWTKMKALYPFVGGTSTTHKYNLKDPQDTDAAFRLVFSGGITHSSTGLLFNGTNGFADTKLNNSTTLSQNSTHLSIYSRTNNSNTIVDICNDNGNVNGSPSIFINLSGSTYIQINSTQGYSIISDGDSLGLRIASRINSTTEKIYKNNSLILTSSKTASFVSNANMIIGKFYNNAYWSNREYAFVSIGDGLSDTEASNFYTAVQAFQTTLSRNV